MDEKHTGYRMMAPGAESSARRYELPGRVTAKARRLIHRGVRRVFAVFLKRGRVAEWSPVRNDWITADEILES
jgi:hypothetical protein